MIRPVLEHHANRLLANAIADATADLGDATQIRSAFVGFQKYLYQPLAA